MRQTPGLAGRRPFRPRLYSGKIALTSDKPAAPIARGSCAARLARVANVRADALHKATTALAREYETVIEDLNVAGMLKNHHLAGAIADQGLGRVRRLLQYETVWNGGRLVVADRWFPSSKTCSACGAVKAKLSLSERIYQCESCGQSEDRDVNAARNLLRLAASGA